MKRRTARKQASRYVEDRAKERRRERSSHARVYILTFMRGLIETLAATDISVDRKLAHLASAARRVAPAIMARRATHPISSETTPDPKENSNA